MLMRPPCQNASCFLDAQGTVQLSLLVEYAGTQRHLNAGLGLLRHRKERLRGGTSFPKRKENTRPTAAQLDNTARRSWLGIHSIPSSGDLSRRLYLPIMLQTQRERMGTSGKDQLRKRLLSRATKLWVGGRNTNASHLSSCSGSCFAYRPSTSCRFGGLCDLLGADREPPWRLRSLRSRSA